MLPRAQILLLNNELQWTFKIGVWVDGLFYNSNDNLRMEDKRKWVK
jgi:hypothetical protein